MRMLPGMWWALLGSQARGVPSPPAPRMTPFRQERAVQGYGNGFQSCLLSGNHSLTSLS